MFSSYVWKRSIALLSDRGLLLQYYKVQTVVTNWYHEIFNKYPFYFNNVCLQKSHNFPSDYNYYDYILLQNVNMCSVVMMLCYG